MKRRCGNGGADRLLEFVNSVSHPRACMRALTRTRERLRVPWRWAAVCMP